MKLSSSPFHKLLSLAMGLGLSALAAYGQTLIDLKTQSKSVDFSGASATKPFKSGTVLPASCGAGELFFLLGAPAGKNSYGCSATNTWALQSGGIGIPDPTNKANQVLTGDGTSAGWRAMGGDVTGAPQGLIVGGLRGRALSGTQPVDGQVLRWNSAARDWEPGSAGAVANYSQTFSNTSTMTMTGASHNLGTPNLIVNCYDNSSPAVLLQPASTTVDQNTLNVKVTFATPRTGRCVVNGSGSSGIAPSSGGDLSGLISAATVQGLQNRPVSSVAPSDGQVLTWNQASGQWQPQLSIGGSSSAGGQMNNLGVAYSNASTLNLGAGCSSSSPCNLRFGNTVYSVLTGSSATLQAGAGVAYIYLTSAGVLTVGSNMSIVCSSGCVAASGISAFPTNSIPLFTWQALAAGWDPNGGTDVRSYLSTKILTPGPGLVVLDSGTQSTISVDSATIPTYLTGSANLNFGTVNGNSCANEQVISVPGANPGDSVAAGWPGSMAAGLLGMMRVSAGDTVSVRLCNVASLPASVPQGVFQATIVRSL